VHDIQELKRQGLSITQIAAHTGFNRRTIRKYLTEPATPYYGPRAPRPTKLDAFHGYLEGRLAGGVWNAKVLLREIRERGYTGGYTALKDYLQPKRREAAVVAVRRFETPPGHQAQMDWGHLGAVLGEDGTQKLYGFVFTLSYSRAMYADLATDQTLPTLLRLHEAAFATLGGVPHEILYDRMKTVALGSDERGEVRWQPQFLDFARYWGFVPRLCRPFGPRPRARPSPGWATCGTTSSPAANRQTWRGRGANCWPGRRGWRNDGCMARPTGWWRRPGKRSNPTCCRWRVGGRIRW
jgi:transposase